MGHDEISKRLSAYLDGEVGGEERGVIEGHLGECAVCAGMLREMRALSGLVRGSGFGKADAGVVARIHARVENAARRGVERFAWGLSAVAACLLVAGSLNLVGTSRAVAVTPAAPAAWEGAAVQLSSNDEVTPATNGELAMAQWMVTDLSDNGTATGGTR